MRKDLKHLIDVTTNLLQNTKCRAVHIDFSGGGDSGDVGEIHFMPMDEENDGDVYKLSAEDFAGKYGIDFDVNEVKIPAFVNDGIHYMDANGKFEYPRGDHLDYVSLLNALSNEVFTFTEMAGLRGFEDGDGGAGTVSINRDGSVEVNYKSDKKELSADGGFESMDTDALEIPDESMNHMRAFMAAHHIDSIRVEMPFNEYDGVQYPYSTTLSKSKQISEAQETSKEYKNILDGFYLVEPGGVKHYILPDNPNLESFINENIASHLINYFSSYDDLEDYDDGGVANIEINSHGEIQLQVDFYTADNNEDEVYVIHQPSERNTTKERKPPKKFAAEVKINNNIIGVTKEAHIQKLLYGEIVKDATIIATKVVNTWHLIDQEKPHITHEASKDEALKFNQMKFLSNNFTNNNWIRTEKLTSLSDKDFIQYLSDQDEYGNIRLASYVDEYDKGAFLQAMTRAASLGIDLNHQNISGNTLFTLCCLRNKEDNALAVYELGGDPLIKNNEDKYGHECYKGDSESIMNVFKSATAMAELDTSNKRRARNGI